MPRNSNKPAIRWWARLTFSLVLLALAALWLAGCGSESPGPPPEAKVAQVIDGDTLVLENGLRVRVLGLDAPEMGKDGRPPEFLAVAAKNSLTDLTLNKRVRLEYDRLRYDHYGRLLAYLFLPEGTFVNAEILRQGLARVYFHEPNFRYREQLQAAQNEAMAANRGLWQQRAPARETAAETSYIGNRNSLRVHRPGCRMAARMAPANRVRFGTLKEAYQQGYSPCRSCKP